MMTNTDLRLAETVHRARSWNIHEEMPSIHALAIRSPETAFDTLWTEIASRHDFDDGIVTCEFLALLVKLDPGRAWRLFRESWHELPRDVRRDLHYAAGRDDIFSLDQWLELFADDSTTAEDRKLLLAAFVSGAYAARFSTHAAGCIRLVELNGHHDQAYLDWLERAKHSYGLS